MWDLEGPVQPDPRAVTHAWTPSWHAGRPPGWPRRTWSSQSSCSLRWSRSPEYSSPRCTPRRRTRARHAGAPRKWWAKRAGVRAHSVQPLYGSWHAWHLSAPHIAPSCSALHAPRLTPNGAKNGQSDARGHWNRTLSYAGLHSPARPRRLTLQPRMWACSPAVLCGPHLPIGPAALGPVAALPRVWVQRGHAAEGVGEGEEGEGASPDLLLWARATFWARCTACSTVQGRSSWVIPRQHAEG